jgi:adenylate kinase family enzyme
MRFARSIPAAVAIPDQGPAVLPVTAPSGLPPEQAHPSRQPGRRIVIVGNTGSGKSTLAASLAALLRLPYVELDALHWDANWTAASDATFRTRAAGALSTDGWVVDGNYHKVRDIVWSRADTLIWLDYPLRVNLWRLTKRTVRRVFLREVLWNGNQERFREAFLSRESLYVWAVKKHRSRRREYDALLAQAEYAHLRLVRLHSPVATDRWLQQEEERAGNGNRTRAFSLGS